MCLNNVLMWLKFISRLSPYLIVVGFVVRVQKKEQTGAKKFNTVNTL